MKKNIAIFASGSGTNAENIINYFRNNPRISINLIVTNREDAFVRERAKRLEVDSYVIKKEAWKDQNLVNDLLSKYNIDYIILAGFLLRVPQYILNKFHNRVINIHPALLPKFGGKGMYGDNVHKAVIDSKDEESGITIHFCNENYDEGNIIFQAKCPILPNDTFEMVAQKVHQLEYKYFPVIIEQVLLDDNIESKGFSS